MRKLLLSVVSIVAFCALVGCGSSNRSVGIPPNPSGGNLAGFTNASLAAGIPYVFAVSGSTFNNNFAVVGSFVPDGNGIITSGTRDTVNDSGGRVLDESITGTYAVNADGRGQAVLNGSATGQVIYRFVLQSPTPQRPSLVGELFQVGATSNLVIVDAVGTLQQVSGVPATPAGPYIVRLDGEDPNLNPYGAVGGITFTGNAFTGFIDENDDGAYALENQPLAANGTISLAAGRGTATLTTPNGINTATHNFVVYYVSPTQLQLVSTDRNFFLYGNADLQTSFAANNMAFTGNQVFSISGVDNSGPGNTAEPRVELGRLTLNGDGTLSNAIEDSDTVTNIFSGVSLTTGSSYIVGANGRWTANLNNAVAATTTGLVGWQVSFGLAPQNQKSLVLTTNPTIVETGVLLGQTVGLTNANVSGNYAESLNGVNVSGPSDLELTGNLNANAAGTFTTGTYDAQTDFTGLTLDAAATGTYTIDPILGRSTNANLDNSPVATLPVAMYTVDADTILVISAQQGSIYQGALASQQ